MENFSPFVRYARKNEQRILPGSVRAVDHRIFYCHSGSGSCEIEGECYPLMPGTAIYIPAGVPYALCFDRETPVLSGCNFDFYKGNANLKEPIPPVPVGKFNEADILEKQIFPVGHIFAQTICLGNAFPLEYKFLEIAEEYQKHSIYWEAYCSALLHGILIRVAQIWQSRKMGIDDQKGNAILSYVHANYQQSLTNGQIAEHFGYHEYYISTLVRKFTGLPLHKYLLRYRMHTAVGLLETTSISVTEVAAMVGMPDAKHFSKCFKNIMGVPPSQFRSSLAQK